MITKRLAIIVLLVALGLGWVFVLPKSATQPLGLRLVDGHPALPERVAGWSGTDTPITEKEIGTLGKGTQFARKSYEHPGARGYNVPVTIVLSGTDISNSIHRPERCLDAQGWQILGGETITMEIKGKGAFPVRRLHNNRMQTTAEGKTFPLEAYTYYWFIGEHALTASHWGRYFTDNRDRLLRGVDQRWAFVSLTGIVPPQKSEEAMVEVRKAVDKEMRTFIEELAPSLHGDGVSYN